MGYDMQGWVAYMALLALLFGLWLGGSLVLGLVVMLTWNTVAIALGQTQLANFWLVCCVGSPVVALCIFWPMLTKKD